VAEWLASNLYRYKKNNTYELQLFDFLSTRQGRVMDACSQIITVTSTPAIKSLQNTSLITALIWPINICLLNNLIRGRGRTPR
jgi:hypothetical protein